MQPKGAYSEGMSGAAMNADLDVELRRVLSRLESMPLGRIDATVAALVHAASDRIVALTEDPSRPFDAVLPVVGPTALAAQVAIVVEDYRSSRADPTTTMAASEDAAIIQILKELRRSLP